MALKLAAIIIIIFFSSFIKSSDPSMKNIYGVWKGYYGTESEINEITIKINPQNKVEIFSSHAESCLTTSGGTYKILGDTAIVISGILTEEKSTEVIFSGNLYRTNNFIDGEWDGKGNEKGCFFLQKQLPLISL